MEMLRRQFGIAEPVRRGMELKIAGAGEWRPAALGGSSGVHRDILQGRDTEIGWEDVFTGKFILAWEGTLEVLQQVGVTWLTSS
jgi:proteasome maturation protein